MWTRFSTDLPEHFISEGWWIYLHCPTDLSLPHRVCRCRRPLSTAAGGGRLFRGNHESRVLRIPPWRLNPQPQMIPTNLCHYFQPYKNYVIIFTTIDMLELGLSTQEVQSSKTMLSVFSLPWWTLPQINLYLPRINVFKIHLRIILAKIKGVANITLGMKTK